MKQTLKMSFKKFECPLSVFLICISLTSVSCDSSMTVVEGETTILQLPYPCDSTKVTLQYGTRLPFYSSSNPELFVLHVDQRDRFEVVPEKTRDGICIMVLTILPVLRDDAGTYILLGNNNYITRVGLRVDFPPGQVTCRSGRRHSDGDWVQLHCKASVGSIPGRIQCYQDGKLMPPLHVPSETATTLKQTILVQQNNDSVMCCSSSLENPKFWCECNDFEWKPPDVTNVDISNEGDPCISTEPPTGIFGLSYDGVTIRNINPSNAVIIDVIDLYTLRHETKSEPTSKSPKLGTMVIILVVFSIISLCISFGSLFV